MKYLIFLFGLFALNIQAADTNALTLVKTIPLPEVRGRIDHFALDAQGQRLFLAALGNDTVEVIDLAAGKRIRTISHCSEPQGLGFVPAENRLVIANGGSGLVKLLEATSFQVLHTIENLPDADNVRYERKARLIYVGYGDGALAVIDPENGKKQADIPLAGHPESFQLEKNSSRIFVNVPSERSVFVVDRKKVSVVAKWRLDFARSNFPMALDESRHRLFIGCRSPARLVVLDTAEGKPVAQVEISGDTDDVFIDAKRQRIYVSCGEGFLDVIQQHEDDHYERIAHLPTRAGARTSFYSPESGRLFLAVPRRLSQESEIRVYQ